MESVGNLNFSYDAEGRRISKTESSMNTDYVINPIAGYNQVLLEETDGVITYYIYGQGLISEETNSLQTYYHFDKRGSTIALTDANEIVTDTYEYGPYGEMLDHTGANNTNFLFVGRYGVISDTDTLLFMMNRFYSTDTRRFTSQDVVFGSISDSLSINQFIYTMNNPISFFDPWGRDRWFIDDGTDKGIPLEGTSKDDENTTFIPGLGSVKLTNVKNDINIKLGKGWSYRFEVGDPNMPGNDDHMHLFKTNKSQEYSQNSDGSPKDGPKGGSGPT